MFSEEKMYQLLTLSFIAILVVIALILLFFAMLFFGFDYVHPSAVLFFLISYFTAASLISIMIENSTQVYKNRLIRHSVRTTLIIAVNLLLVIGLNVSISGITLTPEAIIGLTVFMYIGETIFIRWVEAGSTEIKNP